MASIAVIGAGAMGSGVAKRLHDKGCEVLTLLGGRSNATRERAAHAGMQDATLEQIASAELILSIVPPAQAVAVVEALAPVFAGGNGPIFCDANALPPEAKKDLASRVERLGGQMVDGGIIGGPPADGYDGPHLHLCGEGAEQVADMLCRYGIDARVLPGPIGTAAALKTCFGAINKGIIGLTTAMLLAAQRHGAAEELRKEMDWMLGWLIERQRVAIPKMYPKAYRWDSEMHGISDFLSSEDPAAAKIWEGLGEFYTDRARAQEAGEELEALKKLLA
ncbi:3-hydroxyisobutyrate dehydrogenase-like beta-hydroxyacid dehydrogenase [Altererythrobacter atlanticus]|uniref:Tartronate semialdehyde reductase n=1 Tax=Croceibacterium atlanticum TaxID=1267766 RepID=A0A0F7KTG6_9SPHN|nr:NAD(P)-dependent oxidoreductase [Croceibacterium atlanticum]AKH42095.1 tartronate semialdehyde reductase [Croceibacterium atlanticum]MBB5733335.1 3-hydroxyisobutyrate dehydrogenase-like beta-hydroxyacid dehydrogenase [Croceibacterium atlanticum]